MVSVIVPVYNSENYIKRCLDSVVNQTFQDIEIILVNDGSTDCSLDILRKYAEDDDRIKVITQENKGVASTRNKGLQNAKGEFILYVDSDDWIEPHMLANMLTLMEEDVDIVFCGHDNALETCNETYSVYRTIEVWDQKKQLSEFMEHKRMTGMLWNKLIRKSITEECKFNEKTGYGEDAEFLWQVLKRSKKMVVTSEILYHHVPQAGSISHLSFSEKKYTSIPMWERIVADVEHNYPELLSLSIERLMSVAVYSGYEIRKSGYKNTEQQKHIRKIVRKHIKSFLKSDNISKKMKLFAVAIWGGV